LKQIEASLQSFTKEFNS